MSARLEGVAPIVPVRDETVTAAFYRDVLGFEIRVQNPEARYALVARDETGIALLGGADAASLTATAENSSAYVWVRDLDALWRELSPALEALPDGRVRAPFLQAYGMREFHVKDPDGFLLFFGESADAAPAS